MIHVRTAQSLLPVFWPELVERDGLVLLKSQVECATQSGLTERSPTERESFCNHEHVLDHFRHAAWTTDVDGHRVLDPAHADVERARELGRDLSRMWAAKLRLDFPQYGFRVYCTEREEPIVRFHRVRSDERPWLTDAEVASDPGVTVVVVEASAPG
jgi:hypothetical protein